MGEFATWLSETPASLWIQDTLWVIPAVQTVHIVAMAVVMSSILMIDLRILALAGRGQTMAETAGRFLPWLWAGLVVMACSGLLLVIGEPWRELMNWAFWTKMAILATVIAVTFIFHATLRRNLAFWERSPAKRRATVAFGVVTFVMWCAIIVAGRWIAYAEIPEQYY